MTSSKDPQNNEQIPIKKLTDDILIFHRCGDDNFADVVHGIALWDFWEGRKEFLAQCPLVEVVVNSRSGEFSMGI